MYTDTERCVRAVHSKDARFDGWFFTAVLTTRIYCRPSCPAVPPKVENMTFYPSAAACQQAGFRACKRCRPDTSPGSPEWNARADSVARAMRLIRDGVVDREGVPGLAARLGYSARQIERQLLAELGAARSPWPARSAPRPRDCSSRRPDSPWRKSRSPPGSPRSVPSTTPSARSSRSPRANCAAAPRGPGHPGHPGHDRAAAAVPGPAQPQQPLRSPRRDRRPRRRGVARRCLPPHPLPAVRTRHRRAHPAPRPHRLPSLPHRPARPHPRDQPLPLAARPGRRPGGRRRAAARRSAARPAGRQGARPAGAAYRRRRGVRRTGGARPAGLDRRRPHPRGPPGRRARSAGRRPGGRPHPPLPGPGGPRRTRPGTAGPAPQPPHHPHHARLRTRRRIAAAGHRHRLGAGADRTDRAPRLRPLDRRGHRDAGARRPGRLPPHRPRHPARRRGARPPSTPAALTARAAAWRPWRAYAVQYLWTVDDHPINHLPTEKNREVQP